MHDTLVGLIQSWEKATTKNAFIFLHEDGYEQLRTYNQLYQDVLTYAQGFYQRNIKQGDLVFLQLNHCYELIAAFLGAIYIGAKPSILPYITKNTPINISPVFSDLIQKHNATIVTFTHSCSSLRQKFNNTCKILTIEELIKFTPKTDLACSAQGEDIAFIQFSGGTTGHPKGIYLSHRAVCNNIAAQANFFNYEAHDVTVSWVPLCHDMGLIMCTLLPLMMNNSIVTFSPKDWLCNPKKLMQAIDHYRGTISWMPNFAYHHCVRHISDIELEELDLSSWRLLGNAAEPIDYNTPKVFSKKFSPYGFCSKALKVGYGMAEMTVGVSFSQKIDIDWVSLSDLHKKKKANSVDPGTAGSKGIVSCGVPLAGVRVEVVDEEKTVLPERYIGEIRVKSNAAATSYLSTNNMIFPQQDDWFYTGDIGYIAKNQLYICDRKKDIIIVAGNNIYPHDIESCARFIFGDYLGRSVAFGVYDKTIGTEEIILLCEIRKNIEETDLKSYCKQIKTYVAKQINVNVTHIKFVTKGWIVRTTSGKSSRIASRQKYLKQFDISHQKNSETINSIQLYDTLEKIEKKLHALFEELKIIFANKDDSLWQLDIDSLQYVRLSVLVEQHFAIFISMQEMSSINTFSDMAVLIHHKRQPNAQTNNIIKKTTIKKKSNTVQSSLYDRFFERFLFTGPQIAGYPVPYGLGHKSLLWICKQRRLWNNIFQWQAKLVRSALSGMKLPQDNNIIFHNLTCNLWRFWRLAALARCNNKQWEKWVKIVNKKILSHAQQQNCGVILLVSHTPLRMALLQWLSRSNYDPVMIIGGQPSSLEISNLHHWRKCFYGEETSLSTPLIRKQIYLSHQVLQQKGIVVASPDGLAPSSKNIKKTFFDRHCYIDKTFIDLAFNTGAEIIPVDVLVQFSGEIEIQFGKPLNKDLTINDYLLRKELLATQYWQHFQQLWQNNLANIEWHALYLFYSQKIAQTTNDKNSCTPTRKNNSKINIVDNFTFPISEELTPKKIKNYVTNIFYEVSGIKIKNPKENIWHFEIASLQYVQIFQILEQNFKNEVSIEKLLQCTTICDIATYIHQQNFYSTLKQSSLRSPLSPKFPYTFLHRIFDIYCKLITHITKLGPYWKRYTLSYSWGNRLIYMICRFSRIRLWLFPKQNNAVKKCLSDMQLCNSQNIIQQNLTSNFWRDWRITALASCNQQKFFHWVKVEDEKNYRQLYNKQGTILTLCHFSLLPLIFLLLKWWKFDNFMIIGSDEHTLDLLKFSLADKKKLLPASEAATPIRLLTQWYKGKKILEQGGTVIIAPDGLIPQNGTQKPFFNSTSYIGEGFTELALTCKAKVIPVSICMNLHGNIDVKFNEMFDSGTPEMLKKQRAQLLVKQYHDWWQQQWLENFGNISWDAIAAYLQMPVDSLNYIGKKR